MTFKQDIVKLLFEFIAVLRFQQFYTSQHILFEIKICIIGWRCLEFICYNWWLDACSTVDKFILWLQTGLKNYLSSKTAFNWPLVSDYQDHAFCPSISAFEIICVRDFSDFDQSLPTFAALLPLACIETVLFGYFPITYWLIQIRVQHLLSSSSTWECNTWSRQSSK